MQLSIFVATWGRTAMIRSRGIASFLDELSARGFAGVEATAEELGASLKERVEYCRLLQARGLRLIYAAYTSWLGYEGAHPGFTTPPEHLAALDAELAKAAELEAAAPGTLAHINIHGGCDSFDEAQADEYYSGALPRIDAFLATHAHLSTGARSGVSHESHRGRPLFHPTPTRRLLAKHGRDRLKLTLDVSHWHVSSERIVGPDPEALGAANVEWGAAEAALAEAARREEEVPPGVAAERRWLHGEAYLAVEHVHARIGSGQSAQTPPGEDADWNAVRRTEM
ncbi:hypothetical protein EMIHUDRAFT_195881 [Emiliania huxleyi CCMP1516]|nr:hypothetical protein EMIHUDRAFT_195881 [Emiliania huxleyi CCMP1516]EOD17914.1 hypothetical protein EMIHUDRAFT_195881 [Emiliania huxleyi CCMP1516]|eukprot:XP_005770343.1 hypothetical protein EMIHUDRAFT_195881 [Emiliania huxleyi CCMP1516]